LGVGPDGGRVGHDRGARVGVLGVAQARALTGTGLHEHRVTCGGELVHTGGRDGHPVLVGLDLGGDADPHAMTLEIGEGDASPLNVRPRAPPPTRRAPASAPGSPGWRAAGPTRPRPSRTPTRWSPSR